MGLHCASASLRLGPGCPSGAGAFLKSSRMSPDAIVQVPLRPHRAQSLGFDAPPDISPPEVGALNHCIHQHLLTAPKLFQERFRSTGSGHAVPEASFVQPLGPAKDLTIAMKSSLPLFSVLHNYLSSFIQVPQPHTLASPQIIAFPLFYRRGSPSLPPHLPPGGRPQVAIQLAQHKMYGRPAPRPRCLRSQTNESELCQVVFPSSGREGGG